MFGTLGKISADDILKTYSYFSQETGFDISYQNLFSVKIEKNIANLPSAELAHRGVKYRYKI